MSDLHWTRHLASIGKSVVNNRSAKEPYKFTDAQMEASAERRKKQRAHRSKKA